MQALSRLTTKLHLSFQDQLLRVREELKIGLTNTARSGCDKMVRAKIITLRLRFQRAV